MRVLSKLFSIDGHYKRIKNSLLTELPEGKFKFEYLYHNVGYCSIITKLFLNGYIILDADIDYVEFEWICWPDATILFGQRHIPDADGRVNSVDNGIFIHAIVPRHVETVALITRGGWSVQVK